MTVETLLNVSDVARILKCSRRTVAEFAATRKLRSCKIGYLRRYRLEDVEAFIEAGMEGQSHD